MEKNLFIGLFMSSLDGVAQNIIDNVKERLTNRLYMYILSSVLAANWQHILIILKSKNDIELTLGIMTSEQYFSFWYFFLPVLIGTALSLLMPYCTRYVSERTAGQYYLIKNSEKLGQSTLELKLAKQNEKISEINLKKTNNILEQSKIKSQYEHLESQSSSYYKWLKGLLKVYDETGGKIETTDDLKNILLKLKEHNAVYDLALTPGFKKIMKDLQEMDERNKKDN